MIAILGIVGCALSVKGGAVTLAEHASRLQSKAAGPISYATVTPDRVLATVNKEPIYQAEFKRHYLQLQLGQLDKEIKPFDALALPEQTRQQIIGNLALQRRIEQAAQARNIAITDEDIEQALVETLAGQSTVQFEDWLQRNQMMEEELRQILGTQLLTAAVMAEIASQTPMRVPQIHARHILITDRAEIEQISEQLQAGADFVALAQSYSEDEATRAIGGDWGWFPRGIGTAPEGVEAVAFSLEAGQFSPIIESPLGYHIVRVDLKEANRPVTPRNGNTCSSSALHPGSLNSKPQPRLNI